LSNKYISNLVIDALNKIDITNDSIINSSGNSCRLYFNWNNDTYLQIKEDGHFYIYDSGRQTLHTNSLFIILLFYYVKFRIISFNLKTKFINRKKNKLEKEQREIGRIKEFKTKYFE
jgi:hypothetical protein